MRRAITTRHTDPAQQVFGAVLAIITIAIMVSSVVMVLVGTLIGLSWQRIGSVPLLPPLLVILLLIWWLNRRGSILALAWLITIVIILMISFYDPATYVAVAGYPIVHVAFIIPSLLATLLIGPLVGYPVLLATALLLGMRGISAGYPLDEVRRFVIVASLDLALINTLTAVVSFFFRRAIIQHAALATQLEQRVAERTADLDALHQSRQVETAQVAHDLNNFLTVTSAEVSLFFDLLTTGADISREEMTTVFERIMDAQHLEAGLISDLHALSVLKANPSALEIEPVAYDLAVRLRSMSNTMRSYTESSMIRLQLNLPEHTIVCADPKRMDRVVLNLITNAIKFTRGYRHGDGEIAVSLNTEGAWAQLEIADNGIGITSAGLAHVGERWVRERREQLPPGTGLGLSFSMAMVQLFGGNIEVSSPGTNQGTTVRVRLPLAPGPSLL